MPLIDDVIERLQGNRVFITLDLENGFCHVPVEPNSRKYISFVTHACQFEFLYVPFGISNSPAVFSRFIYAILLDMVQDGTVVTYMDDPISPPKDINEGIQELTGVLSRASEFILRIKWSKCPFFKEKVDFIGYIVEGETIRPSEAKTQAVKNPSRSKESRAFSWTDTQF